jgi:hypothetical protein
MRFIIADGTGPMVLDGRSARGVSERVRRRRAARQGAAASIATEVRGALLSVW